MNYYMPFILSFIAGLSTTIGTIFIFFKPKNIYKFIPLCLSFSLGIMILISITDLIPLSFISLLNNYNFIKTIWISIFSFLLGLILIIFINNKINIKNNDTLYKIGILSIIILVIHNIPEGLSLGVTFASNTNLGITMSLLMIGIHNLIVGFMISQSFLEYKNNKLQAFLITSIVGLISYIFVIVGYYTYSINELSSSIMLCISAGALLYVLLKELLPVYFKKYYDSYSLISIIVGICLIAGLIFGLE